MKTNVVMIREMGDFEVSQRTKDSMFNATELLKQWNKRSGMKKEIASFFKMKNTKEFIKVLENETEQNMAISPYLKTRGKNGGTWMHPFLFIDFAMWINPKFKLDVIKFVYDKLIKFRHDAGDKYRSLSAAAAVYPNVNYPQLAKALNWNVFNRHEKGIRQTANQEQLDELRSLEEQMTFAIDMGYIKTYGQLINDLRKRYHLKHDKF